MGPSSSFKPWFYLWAPRPWACSMFMSIVPDTLPHRKFLHLHWKIQISNKNTTQPHKIVLSGSFFLQPWSCPRACSCPWPITNPLTGLQTLQCKIAMNLHVTCSCWIEDYIAFKNDFKSDKTKTKIEDYYWIIKNPDLPRFFSSQFICVRSNKLGYFHRLRWVFRDGVLCRRPRCRANKGNSVGFT